MKPNIFLIGFMGTGKTTVGEKLASLTGMEFCDLDKMIEQATQLSISEIFKQKSELWFRELESKLLVETVNSTNIVVATGGGVVLNPTNRDIMKSKGIVVALTASLETLWKRLKNNSERPLLKGDCPRKNLERLYLERASLYHVSDFIIKVDEKTPLQIAEEIIHLINTKITI